MQHVNLFFRDGWTAYDFKTLSLETNFLHKSKPSWQGHYEVVCNVSTSKDTAQSRVKAMTALMKRSSCKLGKCYSLYRLKRERIDQYTSHLYKVQVMLLCQGIRIFQ